MRALRLSVLAVLAAALACARALAASSGNAPVSTTIQAINVMSVTNSGTLQLQGMAGSNSLTGPSDSTAALNLSHNSATPLRVTAEVLPASNPAGHDITLTVLVAGGAGPKTLLLAGATQGVKDVYTNIVAAALSNKAITYGASCTASGTRVAADTTFNFIVTFTSTN